MSTFPGISLYLLYLTWFSFSNAMKNTKIPEKYNRWIGRWLIIVHLLACGLYNKLLHHHHHGHVDLCIIWLADCAFVLVLRLVLKERWRAGGACLRPNMSTSLPKIECTCPNRIKCMSNNKYACPKRNIAKSKICMNKSWMDNIT